VVALVVEFDTVAVVDLNAVRVFEFDLATVGVDDPVALGGRERALVGLDDLPGRQRPDAQHSHRVVGRDALVVAVDVTDVVVRAVDRDEAGRAGRT